MMRRIFDFDLQPYQPPMTPYELGVRAGDVVHENGEWFRTVECYPHRWKGKPLRRGRDFLAAMGVSGTIYFGYLLLREKLGWPPPRHLRG